MEKKWTIHQLERKSDNGFVINVHWRYAIIDNVENKNYYADTYSVISYSQEGEEYVPFEDITELMVIGWIKTSLGEEKLLEMETSLLNQIESQKNPPVVYGLPWEPIAIPEEIILEEIILEETDVEENPEETITE